MLSLFLTIIMPLLLLFTIFQRGISKKYFEQACDLNLEILKQSGESLETFVGDIEFVSKNILGDAQVQEYLKIYGKTDSQSTCLGRIHVNYTIQPIMQHRPNISAISIFDEEQIFCQFGLLVTAENEKYLEEVRNLKGRGLWVPACQYDFPMSSKSEGKYMVSFMRVINDLYSMESLAMERISIDEENICALYSGLGTSDSTTFIVDSSGAVISSTDKSFLGGRADREFYTGGSTETEGWRRNGGEVYTYFTLPAPNWTVIRIDPSERFMAESRLVSWMFYLCLILIGTFALLFYHLQNKTIIRPVKAMADQTERFRDETARIEMCTEGNNEIAVLNRAFVDMSISIKRLIEEEYKSKLAQKEIELAYMQAQINPHFLYNTLESIRWRASLQQQPEIADQIEALSRLFRRMLNDGRSTTTIEEELEHVDAYMKLMKDRFGERLQYEKNVEQELLRYEVLHLVLQPLVENAIVHGIEKKRGHGYVRVSVYQENDSVFYKVEDNGAGADEELIRGQMQDENAEKGAFALKNIHDRIKFRYGDEYGLTFASAKGIGATVTVRMPLGKKRETGM